MSDDKKSLRSRLTLLNTPKKQKPQVDDPLRNYRYARYNAGSFEDVLARQSRLLKDIMSGGDKSTRQPATIGQMIVSLLKDRGSTIRVSDKMMTAVAETSEIVGLNASAAPLMLVTDFPQLPEVNIRAHVARYAAHMYSLSSPGRPTSLEELGGNLLRRKRVHIPDTDAIRLIIHCWNEDRLVPEILSIPNQQVPGNPFYVLLTGDPGLPATYARFLRAFSN